MMKSTRVLAGRYGCPLRGVMGPRRLYYTKRIGCQVVKEKIWVDGRQELPKLKPEPIDLSTGRTRPPVSVRRIPSQNLKTRQTKNEVRGEQGFRKTSITTTATTVNGEVMWEESWWDASDWNGLKELGATKSGNDVHGKSWRESWAEKVYHDSLLDVDVVHKTCVKWCEDVGRDEEWQEEWEEYFVKGGECKRWSKKWGKRGAQVWHENWGDEFDGAGTGSLWTDKWYEDVFEEEKIHWGEKWQVELEDKCEVSKWGENWRCVEGGEEYRRWWKETKSRSNLTVHRMGHSTSGEHWDVVENISEEEFVPVVDTNRYEVAVEASPQLMAVYVQPKP